MMGFNIKVLKGFVKVKNPKIREKLGSGWVCQAPARIFFWGGILSFFIFLCVVFMFPNVSIKIR